MKVKKKIATKYQNQHFFFLLIMICILFWRTKKVFIKRIEQLRPFIDILANNMRTYSWMADRGTEREDLEKGDAIGDEGAEEERLWGVGEGGLSNEGEGGVARREAAPHKLPP